MRRRLALCAIMLVCFAVNGLAQVNPVIVGGMKWREIGPFRGGRVLAVTGVPGDPNTYYFGAVAGGIFKSTNGGLSWTPAFDHRGHLFHWRHRGGRFRPQHSLCGQWRSLSAR